MRRRLWLGGASALVLALATVSSVNAQPPAPTGRSPFDWSASYVAGSLGSAAFGDMAATSVNDKFGVLGRKSQSGLMLSAEYGRLIDAQYDFRLALRSASIPEHIVDATASGGLSYGKTRLGYETLDAEIGRRLQLSDPLALRMFAGVRAIHARDRIEEITLGFSSLGQRATAETWGAGPRAGFEFSWQLGAQPVFLTGGMDGSVLFGRTNQEWVLDTYGGTPPVFVLTSSNPVTLYTLGGKLGVTWFASPGTSLTVGYQAEQVWNLRQAYSGIEAGDVGTIDGRGDNLVHGPFARLAVYFHPAARPMPVADTVPVVWSGLRVGVDAGMGFVGAQADNATLATSSSTNTFAGGGNLEGAMAGVHAGYDLQFGALLAGIEGDVAWSGITGTGKISTTDSVTFDIGWLATLRGRAGWAHEKALVYLTGGAAWASVTGNLLIPGATANGTNAYQGWVAGGGLEYRFAPQWSARAEYLHYDLGSRTFTLTTPAASYSADIGLKVDVLRMGLTRTFAALP